MSPKHLFVLALLVFAISTQGSVSLIDLLKNSSKANQVPPKDKTDRADPVIVDDVTTNDESNPSDFEGFEPCGKANSCGEAQNFKDEKQFTSFIQKYTPKDQPQYNIKFPTFNTMSIGGAPAMAMDIAVKPSALPAVDPNRDFSGTNNQVKGVDQADLLKTDGTYIYTYTNNILTITLAYPPTKARVVGKINLKGFNPSSIFIQGKYLAVFGTEYNYYSYPCPYWRYPIWRGGPIFADAAIAAAPAARLLQQTVAKAAATNLKVEPALISKIAPPIGILPPYYGDCQQSNPYTWIKIYDTSNKANPFLVKQFKVEGSYFNGRKIQKNGFVYLVLTHEFNYRPRPFPWFDFGLGVRDIPLSSIFWYPGTYIRPSAVNIVSFDLRNPLTGTKNVATICAEYTNIMYMSEKHIYLTTNSWESGGQYTKIRKIFVYGKYIKPIADGKVQGSVNNQFSLDQYGPFLRIATTSTENGQNSNNVFCLSYYLGAYGSLTGIAPGERIFSARYVLLKLYLVTFRQVDPFFVISLKNHKKPKILGQLKIPGFSRYLHPYDEDTIIGYGRDADANGRQQGLKVAIFDVRDPANPKQTDSLSLKQQYAYSNAEWEHKAFLLATEKNLLVVPANMDYNGTKFNGALAFHISPLKVKLGAIIDHVINPTDNYWERNVQRSLYIEDYVYTKSKCLIRINEINEKFDGVKNIDLCKDDDVKPIIPIIKPPPIRIDPIIPIPIDPIPIRTPIKPIKPIPFDPIIKIDDPILADPV